MPEDRYTNRELLEKLLLNTTIFSSADKDKLIEIVPELKPMMGCSQNHPAHVYDVWEHTIKVIEAVDCNVILKLTAQLHDSGKPYKKTLGDDGFDHFYGHEGKSAEIAKSVLTRLRYDEKTIERICLLIKYHDVPTKPTAQSISKTQNLVGKDNLDLLFRFQMADMKGHEEGYGVRKIKALMEVMKLYSSIGL